MAMRPPTRFSCARTAGSMARSKTSRARRGSSRGLREARASQLRAMGARDLADLMELVASGDIRFAKNAVIVFAGCGVAGRRDVDLAGIAARMAGIADATVIASIDVTDQSMGR